jgi:hypothetical protein
MKWAGHELKERREMHKGFGWGNLKERDNTEGLGVNERVILKWIVKNYDGTVWVEFF